MAPNFCKTCRLAIQPRIRGGDGRIGIRITPNNVKMKCCHNEDMH